MPTLPLNLKLCIMYLITRKCSISSLKALYTKKTPQKFIVFQIGFATFPNQNTAINLK